MFKILTISLTLLHSLSFASERPEYEEKVNPGVCLHSIDKRYFVDLKPFERHAESSLFKRGSVINCIPDDIAPDHITDSENYLEDNCGDDTSSLLMYKIC